MKYQYKKPKISINYWAVTSDHLKKIYDFFVYRFPGLKIKITLTTTDQHSRICENFEEYLAEVTKILTNNEDISKIEIAERQANGPHIFKQIWIEIQFGEYSSASIHVVGGDTDSSYKDWIEGAYAELVSLKKNFELRDYEVIKILNERYNKIIFDPNGKIQEKIIKYLKSPEKKGENINVELHTSKEKWWKNVLFAVITGVIISGIVYLIGWN